MNPEAKFIIVWKDSSTGRYVHGRKQLTIKAGMMFYMSDLDCSIVANPEEELLFHLVAIPGNYNYARWAKHMHENLNRPNFHPTNFTAPFKHVEELSYRVDPDVIDMRYIGGGEYISFYQRSYKDADGNAKTWLDCPTIRFKGNELENKIISTVGI